MKKQRGDERTDKGWKQKGGDWNAGRLVEITTAIVFALCVLLCWISVCLFAVLMLATGTRKGMRGGEREQQREEWERVENT